MTRKFHRWFKANKNFAELVDLPIGRLASERVCSCSLCSRPIFFPKNRRRKKRLCVKVGRFSALQRYTPQYVCKLKLQQDQGDLCRSPEFCL